MFQSGTGLGQSRQDGVRLAHRDGQRGAAQLGCGGIGWPDRRRKPPLERFTVSRKRRTALSPCFDAISDGKPLTLFLKLL